MFNPLLIWSTPKNTVFVYMNLILLKCFILYIYQKGKGKKALLIIIKEVCQMFNYTLDDVATS